MQLMITTAIRSRERKGQNATHGEPFEVKRFATLNMMFQEIAQSLMRYNLATVNHQAY